jgi:hypothetical protein
MVPAATGPSPLGRLVAALALALALTAAARPDKETREKFYGALVANGTQNATGDGSIAEMFGRVLDKEFSDSDTPDGTNLDLLRRTGASWSRDFRGFSISRFCARGVVPLSNRHMVTYARFPYRMMNPLSFILQPPTRIASTAAYQITK